MYSYSGSQNHYLNQQQQQHLQSPSPFFFPPHHPQQFNHPSFFPVQFALPRFHNPYAYAPLQQQHPYYAQQQMAQQQQFMMMSPQQQQQQQQQIPQQQQQQQLPHGKEDFEIEQTCSQRLWIKYDQWIAKFYKASMTRYHSLIIFLKYFTATLPVLTVLACYAIGMVKKTFVLFFFLFCFFLNKFFFFFLLWISPLATSSQITPFRTSATSAQSTPRRVCSWGGWPPPL